MDKKSDKTFKELPLRFKLCILSSPMFLLFFLGVFIHSGCATPDKSFVYGVKEYYTPIKAEYIKMLTHEKNPMFFKADGTKLSDEIIKDVIDIHMDSLVGLEEFIKEAEATFIEGGE